ncbi:MAG: biotin--[acetyl-CoA-carboxylase] ligase [Candidatus Abyssubacteria bacterium]
MEKEVLRLLRDKPDQYLSGQAMARKLNVSRAAVWKAVESLRSKGFRIASSANRGYKLESGPKHIEGVDIEVGLPSRIIGRSVVSFDSLPSTIDKAVELAQEGAPEGTVVVADAQTGGRGRLGRRWSSPPGVGIWTSIILRPSIPPREAPKLTLLIAVGVARTLTHSYGISARIKWPNDVIVDGKKICGVLTELLAEQDAVRYIIASFGLNVNQTRSQFAPDILSVATSMRIESGRTLDRPQVFRDILRELDELYVNFGRHGSGNIIEQWREMSCTLGKHVKVQLRERSLAGVARDIDADGSLILELGDGSRLSVAYGDVTILR